MIDKFRKKMKKDGRSLKWFHREYVSKVLLSYNYFIMQLSGNAKMHESVEKIIKAYMKES